jgi:hypothetical protein
MKVARRVPERLRKSREVVQPAGPRSENPRPGSSRSSPRGVLSVGGEGGEEARRAASPLLEAFAARSKAELGASPVPVPDWKIVAFSVK